MEISDLDCEQRPENKRGTEGLSGISKEREGERERNLLEVPHLFRQILTNLTAIDSYGNFSSKAKQLGKEPEFWYQNLLLNPFSMSRLPSLNSEFPLG